MRQFQIELTIIYLYKIPANVILIHSLSDDFNKYWWFFEPYESFGILLDFFQRWLGYVWHTFLFEKYYVVYPERLTVYKVREKHFTYLVNPQQKGSLSNRNYKKLPVK